MIVEKTHRGFELIEFRDVNGEECSLQQSSAIDCEVPGGLERPGSSFVWLGCEQNSFHPSTGEAMSPRMHLNRDQVRQLIGHLAHWLQHGRFARVENTESEGE